MPKSLWETVDAAKTDEDIKQWIDKDMMFQYLSLKEHEIEFSRKMTDETTSEKFPTFF